MSARSLVPWVTTIPILPGDSLYLIHTGCCDEERFAAAFRDAWRSVPDEPRRTLSTYWQAYWESQREVFRGMGPLKSGSERPVPEVPRIHVYGCKWGWNVGTMFSIEVMDTELNFCADIVNLAPDDLLPLYPAQALAAAWLQVLLRGKRDVPTFSRRRSEPIGAIKVVPRGRHEIDGSAVNRIAKSWGFKPSRWKRWFRENESRLQRHTDPELRAEFQDAANR